MYHLFLFLQRKRLWTLTLLKLVSQGHGSLVANRCQVALTQQLQNCCLQKCSHLPPVLCTVNKFALVLSGELLGIIEKNQFSLAQFFSFEFTLKNVYSQMLFRSSLLSSLRWFPTSVVLGKLFFFLLLFKTVISESTSFQVILLLYQWICF